MSEKNRVMRQADEDFEKALIGIMGDAARLMNLANAAKTVVGASKALGTTLTAAARIHRYTVELHHLQRTVATLQRHLSEAQVTITDLASLV